MMDALRDFEFYEIAIGRIERLRKIRNAGAPDCIIDNEKRMVREAIAVILKGDFGKLHTTPEEALLTEVTKATKGNGD